MTKVNMGMVLAINFVVAAWGTAIPLVVDGKTTKVEFLALARPGGLKIKGELKQDPTDNVSGTMALNENKVTGTAKVKLAGFGTGLEMRDKHMKENHLQVEKFPDSELTITSLVLPTTFSSTSAKAEDVPFEGTLNFHGNKKPVKGVVQAKRDNEDLDMKFSFKLLLTDYGMEIPSFLAVKVDNEVEVNATLNTKLKG